MIKFRQKDFAKVKLNSTRVKRLFVTTPKRFKKKVIRKGNEIALNPGKTVANSAEHIMENPVGSTIIAAGYTKVPIPGTTAVGVALEKGAKKIPIYKKLTKGVSDAYNESGLKSAVEKTVNIGINIAKNTPGIGY